MTDGTLRADGTLELTALLEKGRDYSVTITPLPRRPPTYVGYRWVDDPWLPEIADYQFHLLVEPNPLLVFCYMTSGMQVPDWTFKRPAAPYSNPRKILVRPLKSEEDQATGLAISEEGTLRLFEQRTSGETLYVPVRAVPDKWPSDEHPNFRRYLDVSECEHEFSHAQAYPHVPPGMRQSVEVVVEGGTAGKP